MATNREEATVKLQQILEKGLIRHVTNDRSFEDAYLFYKFKSSSDEEIHITVLPDPLTFQALALVRLSAASAIGIKRR